MANHQEGGSTAGVTSWKSDQSAVQDPGCVYYHSIRERSDQSQFALQHVKLFSKAFEGGTYHLATPGLPGGKAILYHTQSKLSMNKGGSCFPST